MIGQKRLLLFLCCLWAALAGCAQQGFAVKNLAKSDINFVTDAGARHSESLLRELAEKLYRRNPRELAKWPGAGRSERIGEIFDRPGPIADSRLQGHTGVDAMELAFSDSFAGDRVFALMAGLVDMIRESYGYQAEFFLFDSLDAQKLYHSARNVEILAWRLTHNRNARGELFLLTNSRPGEVRNLSYERLFGELVAVQDLMAKVISRKRERVINKVALNLASFAFMPL